MSRGHRSALHEFPFEEFDTSRSVLLVYFVLAHFYLQDNNALSFQSVRSGRTRS